MNKLHPVIAASHTILEMIYKALNYLSDFEILVRKDLGTLSDYHCSSKKSKCKSLENTKVPTLLMFQDNVAVYLLRVLFVL